MHVDIYEALYVDASHSSARLTWLRIICNRIDLLLSSITRRGIPRTIFILFYRAMCPCYPHTHAFLSLSFLYLLLLTAVACLLMAHITYPVWYVCIYTSLSHFLGAFHISDEKKGKAGRGGEQKKKKKGTLSPCGIVCGRSAGGPQTAACESYHTRVCHNATPTHTPCD